MLMKLTGIYEAAGVITDGQPLALHRCCASAPDCWAREQDRLPRVTSSGRAARSSGPGLGSQTGFRAMRRVGVWIVVVMLSLVVLPKDAAAEVEINPTYISGRCIKLTVKHEANSGPSHTVTATVYR